MYIDKHLTEKDLLTDLIYSERQISNSYNSTIMESSCLELRQILLKCQSNIEQIQSTVLEAAEIRGWNSVKLASEKEIESIVNKCK
ncbi:spore coat protein [Proteiniborus sp. MB09-C3]|uniref:spore coat protein n=1 Tax=Proteiniborus sp. MB09-C3 TaxID=3050072 RepID=UPI002556B433|nr:spore coat protein [Proteiniborus sp. MB09-C3]WIV11956.1 spore coat protein [Proteiniborus sp. MB09-C3]